MTALEKRIIEISYKKKLSHIGSCLSAVSIIEDIFETKKSDEKFVLSAGHSALALYVIQEKYGHNAEDLFDRCGVHPDRLKTPEAIDCTTGSLGQGITVALGMAMADRGKNVYCLISDGEAVEGSVYESLLIKQKFNIDNLKVFCNWNGYSAFDNTAWLGLPGVEIIDTSEHWFIKKFKQEAHYRVLTEQDYAEIV